MATKEARRLTRWGYERAKSELHELMLASRSAEYSDDDQTSQERRGWHDARIKQLQLLLLTATVDSCPPNDGIVEPGMVLTIRLGGGAVETFLLAHRETGVPEAMPVYSPDSPLGRTLLGAKENEVREFVMPGGEIMTVRLISARPFADSKTWVVDFELNEEERNSLRALEPSLHREAFL